MQLKFEPKIGILKATSLISGSHEGDPHHLSMCFKCKKATHV